MSNYDVVKRTYAKRRGGN